MTVPKKHIKTLSRRLEYLTKVREQGEANSYDLAEIAALKKALEVMKFNAEREENTVALDNH